MLKAAHLTGSVSRNAGGLFQSVRRLVQCLQVTGLEVRVFGVRDEFTDADIGSWAPIQVNAYQPLGPRKFGYSPRFLRELKDYAPDITHTHGIWLYPSVATNLYSRRTQTPYLISGHGMLDPWAIHNSGRKKAIARFLYEDAHLKGARCLRALCEAEARAMRQWGLRNDIAIIPNGIDLPAIPRTGTSRNPSVQDLRSSGRKVLLYLGRIHHKKGLPLLLQAWSKVRARKKKATSEWVLAIAGWDQDGHEAHLQATAASLNIPFAIPPRSGVRGKPKVSANLPRLEEADVVFLGPQFGADKEDCYAHCDAFILPSFSEGVPMVVLEAWAYGKPVLMTPECNLPKGFTAGAALKIETTATDIARGLEILFAAPEHELRALAANGRALVERDYSWPRLAREMAGLYTWILGGGPKPASVTDY